MAQLSYGFATPVGNAGGLYDVSNYVMNSRINGEEADGSLKFGMGCVQGDIPGQTIAKPTAASTLAKFEGIVMNGGITEMDKSGKAVICSNATVNVLRSGRAWVRIGADQEPKYGDPVHLLNSGEEAGCFATAGGIAVNAMFIGSKGTGNVAPIELYYQQIVSAGA